VYLYVLFVYVCTRHARACVCMSMDAPRPDRIPITQTKHRLPLPRILVSTFGAPLHLPFFIPLERYLLRSLVPSRSTYIQQIYSSDIFSSCFSLDRRSISRGISIEGQKSSARLEYCFDIPPLSSFRFIVRYRTDRESMMSLVRDR